MLVCFSSRHVCFNSKKSAILAQNSRIFDETILSIENTFQHSLNFTV